MTSKTRLIFSPAQLLEHWTDEEIESNFHTAITASEKVQFTLWVHGPGINSVGALKRQIIPFLKQSHIWIERHSSLMNDVQTTTIGWYSNRNHPDTINFMTAQRSLNKKIQDYLATHKDDLVLYANDADALPNWNGEYLPPVTLKLFKPDWKTVVKGHTQHWKTGARQLLALLTAFAG